MILNQRTNLEQYGFRIDAAGAHSSRTIMVSELDLLLGAVGSAFVSFSDIARAVTEDNCLQKRSASNRMRTLDNMRILYGLDDNITIFRVLRKLWDKEPESLPLLALLCAYTRDCLLRELTPWVLAHAEGTRIDRLELEKHIAMLYPDRFSAATITSTSQNLNASWTQAGFLTGRINKVRTAAKPSPASVTYALVLGYLSGLQGMLLFESVYIALLDSPKETLFSLAEMASRQGLLRMKRIGDVVEIDLDSILKSEELRRG